MKAISTARKDLDKAWSDRDHELSELDRRIRRVLVDLGL